jgi:hypothetical protein
MPFIAWEQEASMTRSGAAGEALVMRGALHQLVGTFLAMGPEEQRGVAIRVAGPDWTREFVDAEIRELAERPDYSRGDAHPRNGTGADAPVDRDEADSLLVEGAVSTSSCG